MTVPNSFETKIEQYGRLKSQIESFSKDYDSELSRIHWRIREISDKIDLFDWNRLYHRKDWGVGAYLHRK